MQTAHCIALVELPDDTLFYKSWQGKDMTIARLKKAVRKHYLEENPEYKVSFGNGWYTYSYGAH